MADTLVVEEDDTLDDLLEELNDIWAVSSIRFESRGSKLAATQEHCLALDE